MVCGLLAAGLTLYYLWNLSNSTKTVGPDDDKPVMVEVLVPTVTVTPNTTIKAGSFSTASVAEDTVPRDVVSDPEQIIGRVAIATLQANKPISLSKVRDRAAVFGLSGVVPPGMRGVTVQVGPVEGVAGHLRLGDRVDVIATVDVGDELDVIGRIVLQDIELLALGTQGADQTIGAPEAEPADGAAAAGEGGDAPAASGSAGRSRKGDEEPLYPNATLAVTPDDAVTLVLADQRGELRLALRPAGDQDIVPVPTRSLSESLGPEYKALQIAERERKRAEAELEQARKQAQERPVPTWRNDAVAPGPPTPTRAAGGTGGGVPSRPAAKSVEVIRGAQRESVIP